MIELSVSLASNGVVKVPGYEQMVRNAGQLPQPFWLGAACGGGSRSLSASVARA